MFDRVNWTLRLFALFVATIKFLWPFCSMDVFSPISLCSASASFAVLSVRCLGAAMTGTKVAEIRRLPPLGRLFSIQVHAVHAQLRFEVEKGFHVNSS